MSAVQIQGNASGTGTLTIAAPSTNTNRTLTLPDGTGTFSVAGVNSNIVAGTAQTAPPTTPQYFDFTSIPSYVKRVTVMFDAVSTNGTSNWLIQLGDSGGIENTGYISVGTFLGATTGATNYTTGFGFPVGGATHVMQGLVILNNLTGNIWTANSSLAGSGGGAGFVYSTAGAKTLSATLDRVRITTVNGTDTFDAGSINILYE